MKVSIIIPVYNAEKYITECFYSIANQTYKNIEAIFVDDCSNDNSYNMLQELKERHEKESEIQYKIVKHEINKKDCAARNTGIKEATGDYMFFIDNDDIIIPNCIDLLLNLAKKYPASEIIHGGYYGLKENDWYKLFSMNMKNQHWDIIYKNLILPSKSRNVEEVVEEPIKFWLSQGCIYGNIYTPAAWATLYKKDFINNNNIYFPEDLPNVGDLYFRYLCFKKAKIAVLEHTPVYFWRVRADSASHDEDKQYQRIDWMATLLERMLLDFDNEKYFYEFTKWIITWVEGFLLLIKTEKQKTIVPRYLNILNKIKSLINQNPNGQFTQVEDKK
jgi:glycosyltransferase involved in cell wall biosynthesis